MGGMKLHTSHLIGVLVLILAAMGILNTEAADLPRARGALLPSVDSQDAYRLGLALARRGDLAAAQHQFTKAIKFDQRNTWAFVARANIRSLRGDVTGALGDVDYAIHLQPTFALARYVRARVYARERLWASAADEFKAVVVLDHRLATEQLFGEWAIALMAQARFKEAVATFARAIARSAAPAEHYYYRSFAYERLGQLEAAISDLNATISIAPRYSEAHHRRSKLFIRKGLDPQALIDLNSALANDSGDLRALADRAALHQRLGNRQAAAADLQRLSRRFGEEARIVDDDDHWVWPW